MESWRVPIEVCESIIDAIEEMNTLRNCALTCRAWRTRAQLRIWQAPYIRETTINKFIEAVRNSPNHLTAHVHALELNIQNSEDGADSECPTRLNELLLTSKITSLRALSLRFGSSPSLKLLHPRILRMRPRLLACVTALKLFQSVFPSPRRMLDVIWACPNLFSLEVYSVWSFLDKTPITEATAQNLLSSREHLGACKQLKTISLTMAFQDLDISRPYALFNVNGSVFGTEITDMKLTIGVEQIHNFANFLPGVFPALTTLRVEVYSERRDTVGNLQPSMLRMLAERLSEPTKLKNVIFESGMNHDAVPARCQHQETRISPAGP
ncbi:hypothetical protein BC628DRAFT_1396284 [Trametes gibbosa]|nr:hypothetical protein BC628DRAFT_1396284 [Trametes gibbosa]